MLKVRMVNEDTQNLPITFSVIVSQYQGKWVLCQHKQRSTWEVPEDISNREKLPKKQQDGNYMKKAERKNMICVKSEFMG